MTDLREQFAGFREVDVPELWDRIEDMAAVPIVQQPARRWRPVTAALGAAALVLLLIGGVTWLLQSGSLDPVSDEPVPTLAPETLPTIVVSAPDDAPAPTGAPLVTEAPVTSISVPTSPPVSAPVQPVPTDPPFEGPRPVALTRTVWPESPPVEPPSTAPPGSITTVPNVLDVEDWREARDMLEQAGFVVVVELVFEILEHREGPNVEAGISHIDPWPGDEVIAGSTITLVVYADSAESWDLSGAKPRGAWTTFTEDDGLASDCVSAGIDVAPDGSVWSGCTDGLSHFDGTSWSVVRDDLVCQSLAVGPGGDVWVVACDADGDVTVLRFADDGWTEYLSAPQADIAIAPDGTVWIGSGSIWRVDDSGLRQITDGQSGAPLWEVTAGGDGVLWAAGPEGGLWRYDGSWVEVSTGHGVEAIGADPNGGLWAGYDDASFYDGSSWTEMGLPGSSIVDWAFAPDGAVWAASQYSGAFRFDGSGWAQYTVADGLAGDSLTSVAVGPDGVVWFGTSDSGVTRFIPSG
jgi:hypothetical protein